MDHKPTPWRVESACGGWYEVLSAADDVVLKETWKTDAERIVACVNACKDISTEHLTQFPNWKLAVGNMGRPGDVANLILKLGAYREALALTAGLLEDGDWRTAMARAQEALK